jgi:DNA-binding NarL/FixJ family response regulator
MNNRMSTAILRKHDSTKIGQASSDPQKGPQLTSHASGEPDQKISVVISDASYMTSELLSRALGRVKTFNILKSAVSAGETLDVIVELRPDVAIVSTHQADGLCKGLEIVRQAHQLSPKTRCVVLMDDTDREFVIDAFRAGARGIFKRSASMHVLSRCISAVHSGQIWASSEDLQQVIEELQRTMPLRCVNALGESLLTKREQQIVPLVAQGLTNKELSSKLGVSEHTIKNHLFRIYEKLGISSRVELILYAVSRRDEAL